MRCSAVKVGSLIPRSPCSPRGMKKWKTSALRKGQKRSCILTRGAIPSSPSASTGSPPLLLPQRCQQNRLTNLGFPQEGQHRRGSLLFFEVHLYPRGPRVFPSKRFANASPQRFGLRGPSLTLDEEAAAGLSSVPAALVRRDLAQPIAQVGSRSRMPRQKLVVPAFRCLSLV